MASSPFSTAQVPAVESILKLVSEDQRPCYGIHMMEVLATSNPTDSGLFDFVTSPLTYPAHKKIYTVANSEFSKIYENKIHDSIVKALQSSLPEECQWALHVLRMCFSTNQMANPIVVHVLVPRDYLSNHEAFALLQQLDTVISAAQWEGEQIYVDVCQRVISQSDLRTEDAFNEGADLSELFSELYKYYPPLPGFSVGPKDKAGCAGSFSGFIKHGNTLYQDGKEKFMITMPVIKDHEATKRGISKKLSYAEYHAQQGKMAGSVLIWEKANQLANNYNIEIGHVYATSGRDKSQKYYSGSLDWAIFCCPFGDVQNKHSEYSGADNGSGFQLKPESANRFVNSHINPRFTDDAQKYFWFGPNFKPLRESDMEPDEIFFKVASRTSGWKEAQHNEIRATLNRDGRGVTREFCFVTHSPFDQVSIAGDSGAPLIDSSYRPVAIVWGGDKQPKEGFKDVTYATPIREILKDVERRLGWQPGSASYC